MLSLNVISIRKLSIQFVEAAKLLAPPIRFSGYISALTSHGIVSKPLEYVTKNTIVHIRADHLSISQSRCFSIKIKQTMIAERAMNIIGIVLIRTVLRPLLSITNIAITVPNNLTNARGKFKVKLALKSTCTSKSPKQTPLFPIPKPA